MNPAADPGNFAADVAQQRCDDAEKALIAVEIGPALQSIARMRDDCTPHADLAVAVPYLKALWIESFLRSNADEEPLDSYCRVVQEIEALVRDCEVFPASTTRCAVSLAQAQTCLIDGRFPHALSYLRVLLQHEVIRARITIFTPRPLLPVEKAEAAMIIDAYGELARLLQRFRLIPFGISDRRAAASRALLSDGLLDGLLANADVSRWSKRRTLARIGYEAIARGRHSEGRQRLAQARAVLSEDPDLAASPLAQHENLVIDFYETLATDDSEFDAHLAHERLEAAVDQFHRAEFHRREAELELEAELLQLRQR